MYRENTKVIRIGDKVIGGGNPVLIQSMCNTKTEDVEATVDQILKLEAAGCDIIRVAVSYTHLDVYKRQIWEKKDADHTVVRFATSWATKEEDIRKLLALM